MTPVEQLDSITRHLRTVLTNESPDVSSVCSLASESLGISFDEAQALLRQTILRVNASLFPPIGHFRLLYTPAVPGTASDRSAIASPLLSVEVGRAAVDLLFAYSRTAASLTLTHLYPDHQQDFDTLRILTEHALQRNNDSRRQVHFRTSVSSLSLSKEHAAYLVAVGCEVTFFTTARRLSRIVARDVPHIRAAVDLIRRSQGTARVMLLAGAGQTDNVPKAVLVLESCGFTHCHLRICADSTESRSQEQLNTFRSDLESRPGSSVSDRIVLIAAGGKTGSEYFEAAGADVVDVFPTGELRSGRDPGNPSTALQLGDVWYGLTHLRNRRAALANSHTQPSGETPVSRVDHASVLSIRSRDRLDVPSAPKGAEGRTADTGLRHRFLFCSMASRGFLFPAIGIALQLRERGHDVAFVTDQSCQKDLEQVGLPRIPRGDTDGRSFQTSHWGHPISVAVQRQHIEHAVSCFSPDVIVGQHLSFGALIASEQFRIPLAVLGPATYLWPHVNDEEISPAVRACKQWRYKDMLCNYNSARMALGFRQIPDDTDENPFLGSLFLLRSVERLEGDISGYPAQVHLVGDCLWDLPEVPPDLQMWLQRCVEEGRILAYIQHGLHFHLHHYWREAVDALISLQLRLAASVGRMDCELGSLPDTEVYIRDHVPQDEVLRVAKVMISSGTSTAVLGALKAGVPSILFPGGGEQPDLAERCRLTGTARILDGVAAPAEIAAAVKGVLSDAVTIENAMACSGALERARHQRTAVRLLEQLAVDRDMLTRNAV